MTDCNEYNLSLEQQETINLTLDAPETINLTVSDSLSSIAYRHIHTQTTPSRTWTVNHNLNSYANCCVFSTGGVEVEAQITNTSMNQTVIQFAIDFAGVALFN